MLLDFTHWTFILNSVYCIDVSQTPGVFHSPVYVVAALHVAAGKDAAINKKVEVWSGTSTTHTDPIQHSFNCGRNSFPEKIKCFIEVSGTMTGAWGRGQLAFNCTCVLMRPWFSFPQLPSELQRPRCAPGVEPRRSDGPGLSISVYPWRREVNVRRLLSSLVYVSLRKSWCMILCVFSSAGIDPEQRQAGLRQPIVQLLQWR